MQPGYDGAVLTETNVRRSGESATRRRILCRPGTFEFRYGREVKHAAMYHAGIRFAELWEIAGTADAKSPDASREVFGQFMGGVLRDQKLDAMQKIDEARQSIGKWATARLVDYCVMGNTSEEMAQKWDVDRREMAHLLDDHLRAVAVHFRYL